MRQRTPVWLTANQTLTANRTIELGSNTLTVTGTGANVTLPNDSIGTAELAGNAVTSDKLAGSSVETVKLAPNAVTSIKIADDTIVNTDINASAAIAGTKIAPDFGAQLVNTTGDIEWCQYYGHR